MARLAYSYARVSGGRQARDGRDGLDRQSALFDQFCSRHDLQPAPDRLFDAGVSAYSGKHRRVGALGRFLQAAQAGQIPSGAALVVEDMDRFSRERASYSEQLLLDLFDAGLSIGLVRDDLLVDRSAYDADLSIRLTFALRRDAAHEYSAKLGSRVASAWRRRVDAAEHGRNLHELRPWWVDYDAPADRFTLNQHAPLARRIVQLSMDGIGATRVAAILNSEGIATVSRYKGRGGRQWSQALIQQLLKNRALLGEARISLRGQPDRILPAHFPALLTAAEFDLLRQGISERNDKKGRVGRGLRVRNILQGFVHCTCGRPLLFNCSIRKGIAYEYLRCPGTLNATCNQRRGWKYNEDVLLQALSRQRWSDFFLRGSDSSQRRDLQQRILAAEAEEAQARGRADRARANLTDLLSQGTLTATVAATLGQAQLDAERQADQLAQGLAKLRAELRALDARPTGQEAEQALLARIEGFMATDRHDPQQRQRFNAWLAAQGIHITMHQQEGQPHPLLVLTHADSRDELELHQATADGHVVHVKAAPDALHQLWQDHGQVEVQADGSQQLVIDGGAQPGLPPASDTRAST